MLRIALLVALSGTALQAQSPAFDVIIRGGTVLDGSGQSRFDADVGIRNGFIVSIGDLAIGTATEIVDARGLFVVPGFINIHSHASPDALPTAVNMLTQGVTTEIVNADGSGPLDVATQLARLSGPGLAVNVGGYIGFNAIWQTVVGASDRRPAPDEIQRMRAMISAGLDQGAWGVSAGLDYKPGYFARTEEVVRIVDVARHARTNFTNHDRVTPESNFSSKAGMAETIAIGEKSGLVPVITHMKVQGLEQGSAGEVLRSMARATRRGHYVASDAYPYLAGQSGLGSLIIPGWAQEGGRDAMLKRFAVPPTRAQIIKESEEAMVARFGGPQGVYLPRTQQELTAVMKQTNAGAGETVVRILEQGPDPGAILRFGSEDDLIRILRDPVTSMACDCGATTATRVHPRFYGSYPRVLGRYVREQQIMSWEQAIRKSSWLPASTIGMSDRGLIAAGMAADIAVFDPKTILDHATYEEPALPSTGMRFVLVNGVVALRDGVATGGREGQPLRRSTNMPSRPVNDRRRSLKFRGVIDGREIAVDITHRAGARDATGTVSIQGWGPVLKLGTLQVSDGWAFVTGTGTLTSSFAAVSANTPLDVFSVTADSRDPSTAGSAAIVLTLNGKPVARGTLAARAVEIK